MQIRMKMDGEEQSRQSADMWQRYVRAERLLGTNASKLTSDLVIEPNWIGDSDRFWYRWKSMAGIEFARVDPATGERAPAFDHGRLAAALSLASGTAVSANQLPFSAISYADDGGSITFDIEGERWTCDLGSYALSRAGAAPRVPSDVARSPDGLWDAFTRDCNVWLRSVASGEERAITTDGEKHNGYGEALLSPLTSGGIEDPPPPVIRWSPDSGKILFFRVDQREAPQFHLVQSVNQDGSVRPSLHSFAYPLPGDEIVPQAQLLCADVNTGAITAADIDPIQVQYHGLPVHGDAITWAEDSDAIYYVRQERGYLRISLIRIDPASGAARVIVSEESSTGIDPSVWRGKSSIRAFAGGTRVIWYSQRDGWGHLYLYDAENGQLIRQVTSGDYEVSNVQQVDEAAGTVYFTTMGLAEGRDPYYNHLYRVSLEGGEPELLTPEDADHTVTFAPGGGYFIDNYSTVGEAPVILLRAADGSLVCELERADISALEATGWRAPERFAAKARDGSTDIYGVIFRPSDFDESKRYPVIDHIYGGPQAIQQPTGFADAARDRERNFWTSQSLAELGFVVVMIDGLGMPGRSKAYHDHSYLNLPDNGLPDHICFIQQLADRDDTLDISRVGIFGHSAGGYASCRAIFAYPDFYKVAVSSAGNHDHRLDKATWVERYMGQELGDHYIFSANQNHAENLKGKLLLIHGDMDENVHVSSTLVVVDALINANKDFDLLIMPNQPHACGSHPYFVRRRWDYFVQHLLGEAPPAGYQIG